MKSAKPLATVLAVLFISVAAKAWALTEASATCSEGPNDWGCLFSAPNDQGGGQTQPSVDAKLSGSESLGFSPYTIEAAGAEDAPPSGSVQTYGAGAPSASVGANNDASPDQSSQGDGTQAARPRNPDAPKPMPVAAPPGTEPINTFDRVNRNVQKALQDAGQSIQNLSQ